MKKLKHVKIWESFVNEEFTVGNRMTSNLFVMNKELYKLEKGPERDALKVQIEKGKEELKQYIKDNFEVDVYYLSTLGISASFAQTLHLGLHFPEGFFKKLGRFFGLGETKISLSYHVSRLEKLEYTETSPGQYEVPVQDLGEEISLYIGAKRENVGANYEKQLMNNEIELKVEDANKMLGLIREINPSTQIRSSEELVKRMNQNLEKSYTTNTLYGKTDPKYSFAAVNKVVLVA